jgi:hypothetical protein
VRKPATFPEQDAIVRQMTRLQWIYVIVGLLVVAAMVLPSIMSVR